ncbi:MAG: MSCRAMM family protein, partial [Thermoanaerobaculia bacterium]
LLNQIGTGIYEYANASVGAPVDLWAVNGPPLYGDQYAHGSAKVEFPGQVVSTTLRLPGQGKVLVSLQSDIAVIGDVDLSYPVWDEAEQGLGSKSITLSTKQPDGTAGAATFSNVPALQQYGVSSTHPSYGHAEASGTLAYDGDLTTHTLQFNRLSTIRGTVYAIDGVTPIAAASVRLNDGSRDTGVQVSQPDGSFAFFDVPSGITFTIVADATQSGIYRTGVAYGRTSETGGLVSNVNVIMRRRGSVEGRVVYAGYKRFDPDNPANNIPDDTPDDLSDNAPVPLAKVWLRELDFPNRSFGSDAEPLTADVAGRFAFSNVFVGSLRARAWDPGNQELLGDWSGALHDEGEVLSSIYIGVGGGGTGSILVTVEDPNQQNAPVTNAEVGLYRGGGLFDLTSSDANGVARFEQVPLGTYTVSAYSKALGKSGGSAAFAVDRDATSNVRILLEFSGQVDGTLSDPESEPPGNGLPGVAVTLSGAGFQSRASTDLAGAFSFDGVREGLFTLNAKDTDSNRRASASHTLSAADPHPIVNLELERTETLYVSVYLPDDTGGNSGVLSGPVVADVVQRCFNNVCDFQRSVQGNPIVISKLFLSDDYGITVKEIGGEGRSISAGGRFPKGNAADPIQLVYRA